MSIFVSYSRKDSHFAHTLYALLLYAGFKAWLDVEGLEAGEWTEQLTHQLEICSHIIVIFSPDALASEWVTKEYKFAQQKQKKIIPLILHECKVPNELEKFQRYDFTRLNETWLNLQKFLHVIEKEFPHSHRPHLANQHQNDLNLLQELWKRINPEFFQGTVESIGSVTNFEQYEHVILGYLNTREEPTAQFIDQELEKTFEEFDRNLREFDHLVNLHNVSLPKDGKYLHMPRFKGSEWVKGYHEYSVKEVYKMSEQYEKVYTSVKSLLIVYRKLVGVIKAKFPEFVLDRDGSYYFKPTW